MSFADLEKLKSLVKIAAKEELLKDFGHSEFAYKDDGSVITPADMAMQSRLEKELNQYWPMYGILGEEMTDEAQFKSLPEGGNEIRLVKRGVIQHGD